MGSSATATARPRQVQGDAGPAMDSGQPVGRWLLQPIVHGQIIASFGYLLVVILCNLRVFYHLCLPNLPTFTCLGCCCSPNC